MRGQRLGSVSCSLSHARTPPTRGHLTPAPRNGWHWDEAGQSVEEPIPTRTISRLNKGAGYVQSGGGRCTCSEAEQVQPGEVISMKSSERAGTISFTKVQERAPDLFSLYKAAGASVLRWCSWRGVCPCTAFTAPFTAWAHNELLQELTQCAAQGSARLPRRPPAEAVGRESIPARDASPTDPERLGAGRQTHRPVRRRTGGR